MFLVENGSVWRVVCWHVLEDKRVPLGVLSVGGEEFWFSLGGSGRSVFGSGLAVCGPSGHSGTGIELECGTRT